MKVVLMAQDMPRVDSIRPRSELVIRMGHDMNCEMEAQLLLSKEGGDYILDCSPCISTEEEKQAFIMKDCSSPPPEAIMHQGKAEFDDGEMVARTSNIN
ncbi:hypothetical protein Ancab_004357 [Ancistrocladus abbreviatus]